MLDRKQHALELVHCFAKLLKIQGFFRYAQTHSWMRFILNGLRSSYGRAHTLYDQTHGAYGQTHGTKTLAFTVSVCKIK